jgi:ABC-type phosphate transport system permease subunit
MGLAVARIHPYDFVVFVEWRLGFLDERPSVVVGIFCGVILVETLGVWLDIPDEEVVVTPIVSEVETVKSIHRTSPVHLSS